MQGMVVALAVLSTALVGWTMLRKLGIGTKDGKSDCGCGSGSKCETKGVKR